MPSRALAKWIESRERALDEIAAAHVAVGGHGPGRRRATEQVNHAYAMLLSSQFQGFCRDLHTESVQYLVTGVQPEELRDVVTARFVENRKLDSGNPNPGNLGSDFGRLGIDFWPTVKRADPRGPARQAVLIRLMTWRNAIAHQDFPTELGRLHLAEVRTMRTACSALAKTFDAVVGTHVARLTGTQPW